MSERAKIRARRVTGNDQQQQAAVARAIKVAREMALLPYSVRQTQQRSKGGKGRDRERDRDLVIDSEIVEPRHVEGGEDFEEFEARDGVDASDDGEEFADAESAAGSGEPAEVVAGGEG
jgi:small subunit ribosomal protein S18